MKTARSRYPAPKTPQCPDCKVDMEPGIIPDTWNALVSDRSAWISGIPGDNLLTGLKLTGKLMFPIVSFRCGKCGLLREYAFRPTERHG
ncbi:MAG: hypothetical protein JNL43_02365 [Flavobacteriales bacterium]|nr:hypothetical protein [Flavobacteriales bacterium]